MIYKMKKYLPLIKFFGIFLGVIAAYYVMITLFPDSIDFYINATAQLSSWFLSIFGIQAVAQGASIITDELIIALAFGCEGSEPIVLYIAAVSAFPALLKPKLIGGLFGVLILYFLNLIRIMLLYYIGLSETLDFDLFHVIIFPVIFIIIALIVFVGWLKWQNKFQAKVS
jgi:exosortase/archaeosortase family protein